MSGVFRSQQAPGAVFGTQVQGAAATATPVNARSTGTASRSAATVVAGVVATATPVNARSTGMATRSAALVVGPGVPVTPANTTSSSRATRSRARVLSQLPSADRAVYISPLPRANFLR